MPHPLASDGEELYRYRITDSIRVEVPSLPAPIRVYEVEVVPRRDDVPAFVGSVFLEAETGALARMVFTFTPASYVDPRSDRITVRLEHALWEETLWLPYRQVVEVRREIPEFDLPVGSVIRATLEVTGYDFNPELEPGFFSGPRVTMVPYGAADSTEFRAGLTDRMAEEGLSPVSMARIEAEARQAAPPRLVSGLPRSRLYADGFSSILRTNRAEGVHIGAGASFVPRDLLKLNVLAGYGTANGKFTGAVRLRWATGDAGTTTTLASSGASCGTWAPVPARRERSIRSRRCCGTSTTRTPTMPPGRACSSNARSARVPRFGSAAAGRTLRELSSSGPRASAPPPTRDPSAPPAKGRSRAPAEESHTVGGGCPPGVPRRP